MPGAPACRERAFVAAHPDLAVVGGRRLDDSEVRVGEESGTRQDVELDEGVDLPPW